MNRTFLIALLFLGVVTSFLGLNYQQLGSAWTIWSETARLAWQAWDAPDAFQNPEPLEDHFEGTLSPEFWKFTTINGHGQVSNGFEWHAAAIDVGQGLTLQHFPDPDFQNENADLYQSPAAGRYNNVTLIGGSSFRPSPSSDVVLTFSSKVSKNFYGSSGVIFQPEGTLHEDGLFAKPFDMFGFAIIGDESSIQDAHGPLCYLALNWMPDKIQALHIDARTWHEYEIRLRWINKIEWLGIVSVDQKEMCRLSMPAFGAVEVQVWSDNARAAQTTRRWWEIEPVLEMSFEEGGEKQFELRSIRISTGEIPGIGDNTAQHRLPQ